jgi:hypothetical protein
MKIDSGNAVSMTFMGAAQWTNALANGDILSLSGFYEANADA